jgi:hypothetical protein
MPRPLVEQFMREFDDALETGCRNTGLDVRFSSCWSCIAFISTMRDMHFFSA